MKIAIIGSGIAGNTAARLLRDSHDITVYESQGYAGGHTNTVDVPTGNGKIAVDTGFIVFNDRTYPQFNELLGEIGQRWQPSVMSFSVQSEADGLEYNGASLNTLFAQRRNLLKPSFWRMVRDILRFNREALAALHNNEGNLSLGAWLDRHQYSPEFTGHYLVPMAAAIWSSEPGVVQQMPLRFLVRFFQNHGLLQLDDRPSWRVIEGGSREYVRKLITGHVDRIRLNCAVQSVRRTSDGVYVRAGHSAEERYDSVFMACHSDQSLALLRDATPAEREILGAIRYKKNEAVLHTDRSLLPSRRRAWAAWNYHIPANRQKSVIVTYNMNILQGLNTAEQYCVTLNNAEAVAPDRILHRVMYEHPVFTRESVAAQARHGEINSGNRTFYCGAYWRNGFHEDGVVSAINAVRHFEEALQRGQLHFRRAG